MKCRFRPYDIVDISLCAPCSFTYTLHMIEPGWLSRNSGGLYAGQPEFDSRQGQHFSLLQNGHTGSGTHPASYIMGTGSCSLGVKRPGREAYRSPPSGAEVMNGEAILSLSHKST
jgi:hypothetical protein